VLPSISFAVSDTSPTALSSEDQTKVNEAILKLQSNIQTSGHTVIDTLTSDFKNMTNYEDTGSGNIKLSSNQWEYGSMSGSLNYDNIINQKSWWNSKFSGNISGTASIIDSKKTQQDLTLSSFVEIISVDGKSYLKLKDLSYQFTDPNTKAVFDQLKAVFEKSEYLKLPENANTENVMKLLRDFSLTNLNEHLDSALSKPLFQAYTKKWDAYLLVPSKHACDTYFDSANAIGSINSWYTPSTCTDSVYKAMVKEFLDAGELSLTLWTNSNTLSFVAIDDYGENVINMVYDDTSIQKFEILISPDQDENPWEKFNFIYIKGQSITIDLYADGGNVQAKLNALLDANNNIVSMTGNAKSGKDFLAQISLKDHKLAGFIGSFVKWYDYTTNKYKYTEAYGVKITGITDTNNSLTTFKIKAIWLELKTKKKIFVGSFSYQSGDISLSINAGSEEMLFVLQAQGSVEKDYFKLSGNFSYDTIQGIYSITLNEKDSHIDANVNLNVTQEKNNIFSIDWIQTWIRTRKEIKIEAPVNSTPLEDTDLYKLTWSNSDIYLDQ